nr:retrovirus-related Pol polyprotein from transposon TNT 1-94 [Tanacetum cinerariifolium]
MQEIKILSCLPKRAKDPSSSWQKDLVFVKSSANDTKVSILGVERPWLSETKGFILPNHDNIIILSAESQMKVTNPSITVTDSSTTEYGSANESSVCSTPLPLLEKLVGLEPVSGSKTIKSILMSNFTFKAKTLKGVTINKPTSDLAKGNKNILASKKNLASSSKLNNVKIEDDIPLSVIMKELKERKLQINKNQSSYSKNNNPQQYDIKKPIWYLNSGCSRHMTGAKGYLHKYVEQSGPKFYEKKGIIFNSNKEVVMIAFRGTKETYHTTFDESTKAIKFSKPLVDDINIAESERYPPNEYLYPYEASQRYQVDSNVVQYIEPYEKPKPIVIEADTSLD